MEYQVLVKIVFPSQERVGYLRQYVDDVLRVIAEATQNENIVNAMVSDQTVIDHFIVVKYFDPEINKPVEFSEEEYKQVLSKISEGLGIVVQGGDYLVEVARRLAHGD